MQTIAFETPLILKLRKAGFGPAVTAAVAVFTAAACAAVVGTDLWMTYRQSAAFVFWALALWLLADGIARTVTLAAAKRTEKPLSAGGYTFEAVLAGAGLVLTALAATVIKAVTVVAMRVGYYPFRSRVLVFEGDGVAANSTMVHKMPFWAFYVILGGLAFWLVLLMASSLSTRCSVVNNRPHRTFSVLCGLFSMLMAAVPLFLAVWMVVKGALPVLSGLGVSELVLTFAVYGLALALCLYFLMSGISAFCVSAASKKES